MLNSKQHYALNSYSPSFLQKGGQGKYPANALRQGSLQLVPSRLALVADFRPCFGLRVGFRFWGGFRVEGLRFGEGLGFQVQGLRFQDFRVNNEGWLTVHSFLCPFLRRRVCWLVAQDFGCLQPGVLGAQFQWVLWLLQFGLAVFQHASPIDVDGAVVLIHFYLALSFLPQKIE